MFDATRPLTGALGSKGAKSAIHSGTPTLPFWLGVAFTCMCAAMGMEMLLNSRLYVMLFDAVLKLSVAMAVALVSTGGSCDAPARNKHPAVSYFVGCWICIT